MGPATVAEVSVTAGVPATVAEREVTVAGSDTAVPEGPLEQVAEVSVVTADMGTL